MSEDFYQGDSEYGKDCNAKVISAVTLPECPNESKRPEGISGPLVAKIPVVIAEPVIQIDVKAEIELEEPAIEIKRIKKNLFLTQCKLINIGDKKKGKLFISGFIRKNIEFATANCKNPNYRAISGDIRHTTADVHFECVTVVDFVSPPVFCKSGFVKETEIFSDKIKSCDICEKDIIGHDTCERNFEHFECFSEKVFCELEDVRIFEEDHLKNPVPTGCKFPGQLIFDKITEKMVIFAKIKVLQNQQVNIPKSESRDGKKHYDYTERWPWMKKNESKRKNKHEQYYSNNQYNYNE